MRKPVLFILLLVIFIFIPGNSSGVNEPEIDCQGGAILVEYKTQNIIFSQDADKQWPPASITKVMTAIIALERGNLTDEVKFSKNAVETEKSNLEIEEGVRIPLYPLIEAMLVKSGNDAAVAIAEHIAGSEKDFVKLMNDKAKALAMFSTKFVNASGLPDDDQYSTAADLSRLVVYSMGVEAFRQIVAKREVEFVSKDGKERRTLYSTNKLLGHHPLVDGVKTGFTNDSRYCLAASAAFRDYRLISIVLGAEKEEVWLETARLLDYGFEIKDPLYPLYRKFDPIPKEELDEDPG